MNFLNARFGDDGKVWHIVAASAISVLLWYVIIDATINVLHMIF